MVASAEEVALAELAELADERGGQAAFVERVKRFAGRQLGGAAEPRDPPCPALVGFELEDGEQHRQRGLLVGFDEAGDELACGGRQREGRSATS